MGATVCLIRGEQTPHSRTHAEDLKEVADDVDARCRLGLAVACQTLIVRSAESKVSGHVLIDTALSAKFLICVGGVSSTRETTSRGWWSNPNKLMRVRKRQRT